MYNNFKKRILGFHIITFAIFIEYWCLLNYAYIPYGNIKLDNKICNIIGSERIEYDFSKYIMALNLSISGDPILGRAYICR